MKDVCLVIPMVTLVASLVGCGTGNHTAVLVTESPLASVETAIDRAGRVSATPNLSVPMTSDAPALTAPPTVGDPDRQAYNEYATTVAAAGGATLVPYETAAAESTQFAVDSTQYVESFYTPTPFGPLPFPGTRLTDDELAERGWSRMTDDGQRNEDYHTTAIWLDKAYVDAEIFSKYQALFELLAFRDGPPGEDFEAQLGELMIVDKAAYSDVDATLSENRDFENLASCGFEALRKNVLALEDDGAYLTYDWVLPNTKLVWDYGDPLQSPPTILTNKLTAFEANSIYFAGFRMQGAPPGANESATIRFTIKSVATGEPLGSWLATYDPFIDTRYDAAAAWVSEAQSWRFLSFGSQFCDSVYPDIITKHLGS